MTHKYNIGDIIHDNRFNEYYLIMDIELDDLFQVPSYLLKSIYGSKEKTLHGYFEIRGIDRSNEYALVA